MQFSTEEAISSYRYGCKNHKFDEDSVKNQQ